jgi:serine/threonine protein kinase
MRYANDGSLTDYITKEFKKLKWKHKIRILYSIISGLNIIHQEKLVHHDFHSGNILHSHRLPQKMMIADLGLSAPADQEPSSIVGVLPYIAPEVLNGKPYTQKSDIYSFGILMSVISTGQQPFNDKAHGHGLMLKICEGLRPAFSINTPKFYIELAYKCMDADPDNRPTAEEILKIIAFWKDIFDIEFILEYRYNNYSKEQIDELRMMGEIFDQMDDIEYDPSTIPVTMHPNAVYTSRILKSTNLPQPRNSNKVTIISNNHGNYLIYLTQITSHSFH